MATQQVNERLAALTAAGTSVWLDQIGRQLIESGELRRLVEEDCAARRDLEPDDLQPGDPGRRPTTTTSSGSSRARAGRRARSTRRSRSQDIQAGCDVLRPVYDETDGYDGYVSFEVDPDLAFDTEKTIEQAREYWSRVDRPNLMIKIPGTDEGAPGDRGDDLRGAEHQRHAAVLGRRLRARRRGVHPRPRAPPRRGQERRPAVGRVVLRLARGHRGRQAPRGAPATPSCSGTAGLANARAAYRRFKAIFHGERFAALREAGASVQRPLWASTGVKNPHYPETMYVDGLVGPRDGQHDADGDAARRRRPRERRPAPTVETDPDARPARARARRASTSTTSPPSCCATASTKFVEPMDKLLDGHRRRSARRSSPSRPPTIEADIPDELEPRIAERVAQGDGRGRRAPHLEEGRHALGPGRPGRGRQPARLADDRRHDARGRSTTSRRSRARSATRASTDVVLLGMGGSSLAPEVIRLSFGDQRRLARAARARLDRRGRDPRRPRRRSTSTKTLFLVSSKSGGTIETLSLFKRYFWALRPDGPPVRRDHRPGLGPGRPRRASTASGARSSTTPTSAGATARCRTSGSCPRR